MLREAYRVIRPEGQIVIAGFNPFSLYGAKRYFGRAQRPPWNGNFIALYRLKDWLTLLGFEVVGGRLDAYAPPFSSEKWLHRFGFFESIGDRWSIIDRSPQTLIHNDFNTRNIALRRRDCRFELCAYDWELATVAIPQTDLAEFLCFVLSPDVTEDEALRSVERHRAALVLATGGSIDAGQWHAGFRAALADLIINRLAFYTMINRVKPQAFLPRIVKTWWRLHTIFS